MSLFALTHANCPTCRCAEPLPEGPAMPTDAPTPSGAMLVWEQFGKGAHVADAPLASYYEIVSSIDAPGWYANLIGGAEAEIGGLHPTPDAARAACEADCRERMAAAGWVPAAEAERWKRVSGEWMKGFADAKLALRDLVDRAPQLGAPTPEPNLRAIVEGYYRLHGIGNWQELASKYLAEIATPAPPVATVSADAIRAEIASIKGVARQFRDEKMEDPMLRGLLDAIAKQIDAIAARLSALLPAPQEEVK